MKCVVQKYGGSSVSDLEKIRGVAKRIHRTCTEEGVGVVAVVSAMGNTTQQLIDLATSVSSTPDRRELDMLVSVGERISMALLAMALKDLGVDARSLTGSQSGIITDESHADATVVEVRPARVRGLLEQGKVVIVAGFQGVSREREVTTLGRGGSDTTAVVLAAALQAEYCEICSDVDGVWSADPRVVRTAERLDEMGLDEALGLARGGAKVLYEQAVKFARDRGVVLRAASTFGPGSGTKLVTSTVERSGAAAVTHDDQLVEIHFQPGTLAAVAEAVGTQGGKCRRIWTDRMWVDVRNVHGELILSPVGARQEPVCTVTAIGSGLGERGVLIGEVALALEQAEIPATLQVAGGDEVVWTVPESRVKEAVRLVHASMVA